MSMSGRLRRSVIFVGAMAGALGWVGGRLVAQTQPATGPARATLAVLPFVASSANSKDKELAQRMRFAVSQKLSTDANGRALTGPDAFERLDNVQIDQLVSALEVSFADTAHAPDDEDMQKVLAALDVDWTIGGSLKGRELDLVLYQGRKVAKKASVVIPPDNESPKLAVEKVLTDLTGASFAHVRDVQVDHSDAKAEARFAARPNLVPDFGFELAAKDAKKVAVNWEALLHADHYPPPVMTATQAQALGVDRVAVVPKSVAGDAKDANGFCLMMRMSKEIAENNGLACESTWMPVEGNKKYRFTVKYHSTGPTTHIFLKGFAEKADQFSDKNDPESLRREFYRAQVLPTEKNAGWELLEMDFTPSTVKATDPKIQWLRVDLYIYLKPGDVFFDDCVVKRIDE
jgi:hypothetical protein